MSKAAVLAVLLLGLPCTGCADEPRDGAGTAESKRAAQATPSSAPVSKAAKRPKIIPWLEVNRATPEELERAVAGLRIWQKITDTAVISTVRGKAWIYPHLRARVPGLRIIPGLKTNAELGKRQFDSPEVWQRVARGVTELCSAAEEKRIVLENESALSPVWRGDYAVDFQRLRESLKQLPKDIEIIWYPGVVGESEVVQARAAAVCRAVEEICTARFTAGNLGGPKSPRYRWSKSGTAQANSLASRPLIPLVYFGTKYWPYERAPEIVSLVKTDEVLFYPGAADWIKAARTIVRTLATPAPEEP